MSNDPTSPNSFEHSRLADLVVALEAIAALGLVPDATALHDQQAALYARVRALRPTMIAPEEEAALNLLIGAMAETRKQTLGA